MAMTLEALRGRVLDLDSHEAIPPNPFVNILGDRAKLFAKIGKQTYELMEQGFKGAVADTVEITPQTVWERKNFEAPGAVDMNRRTAVMDARGVQRQLVFPSLALAALSQAMGGLYFTPSEEEKAAAWGLIDAYNE